MIRRCDLQPGAWFRYAGGLTVTETRANRGDDGHTLFQSADRIEMFLDDDGTERQRQVLFDLRYRDDQLSSPIVAEEVRYYVVYPCDPPEEQDGTSIRFSLIELD